MNKLKQFGTVALILSIFVVSGMIGSQIDRRITPDVPVQVSGGGPIVGGITRTAIGAQVKWTTDLIPSSSFTVNLGSAALPVNQLFFTMASGSRGEFTSYASASAYKGVAFPSSSCTGSTFLQWATTGLFTCGTPSGASKFSTQGLAIGVTGGTFAHVTSASFETNSFTFSNTASVGFLKLNWGANGVASRSATNTWSALNTFSASPVGISVSNSASVSANFEAVGYASVGGNIFSAGASSSFSAGSLNLNKGLHATGNVTTGGLFFGTGETLTGAFIESGIVSNSFLGSLSGSTTGTLSVGTSNNPLKTLWSNIVHAVNSFFAPTTTTTTAGATTSGLFTINTASDSEEYGDGSNYIVHPTSRCFTYVPSPVTSINQQIGKRFLDPFTITAIAPVASPSGNSVGWNLYTGAPGSVTTAIFSANKSASSSTSPKYTAFSTSALTDGSELDVKITSASSKVTQFSITICGRYTK